MAAQHSSMGICGYEQLANNAGVIYHVRFIATIRLCIRITDLENKNNEYISNAIKECISKGCEITHLKLPSKRGKSQRDNAQKLEDVSHTSMVDSNLQISEEHVIVSEFETYKKIHDVCSSDVLAVSMGDISSLDCIGILVKQTLGLSCLVIQSLDGFITDEIQAAVKPAVLQFKSRRRASLPCISMLPEPSNTIHSNTWNNSDVSTEPTPTQRNSSYVPTTYRGLQFRRYSQQTIPEYEENYYSNPDKEVAQPSVLITQTDSKKFTAYLGDLPNGTQPIDIYEWLNDLEISNVQLDYDDKNIFLGTARVEFYDFESTKKAIRQDGFVHGKRRFSIHDHPPLPRTYGNIWSSHSQDTLKKTNAQSTVCVACLNSPDGYMCLKCGHIVIRSDAVY